MEQITCKNLCIGYDNKVVVKNINMSISSGDYLCVIGENGAGKSTFIKTILGLIPQISGSMEFAKDFDKKGIGYLPQKTVVQKDFPATVMEVVLSGFQNRCKFRPFYTNKEKEMAKQNIIKLGIENIEKNSFKELSGGQQQRVLLARALCSAQNILLLDEPVAGLDPLATEEMYKTIKKLNKQGVTIVMVTHDVATSLKYASNILFVGKQSFFGTSEEFENSKLGQKHKHFVGGCCNHE